MLACYLLSSLGIICRHVPVLFLGFLFTDQVCELLHTCTHGRQHACTPQNETLISPPLTRYGLHTLSVDLFAFAHTTISETTETTDSKPNDTRPHPDLPILLHSSFPSTSRLQQILRGARVAWRHARILEYTTMIVCEGWPCSHSRLQRQ